MEFGLLVSFLIIAFIFLIVTIQSTIKIGKPFTNHYFLLSKEEKLTLNLDSTFCEIRNQSLCFVIVFGIIAPILYFLNIPLIILIFFTIPFLVLSSRWYMETEKDLDRQRKELRNSK